MLALMVGDAHGSNRFMSTVILKMARRYDPEIIFQMGDFGFWEHEKDGIEYLDRTESKLGQIAKNMYFLDGNHENHPLLRQKYLSSPYDPPTPIRPHLFYMPRGCRFEMGGIKFLALGGAYSIDKGWRLNEERLRKRPGTLWWPQETITAEEAYYAKEGGEVDVMLTHDSPWGIPMPGIKGEFWESNENRRIIADVVQTVKPKFLFHGHYHMPVDSDWVKMLDDDQGTWQHTRVIGLSFEHSYGAVKLVDFRNPVEESVIMARP